MPCPIALQLHTVREQAAQDLPGVLDRIRRIGYRGVESADFHGRTPAELRALCDGAGLALPSAHAMALGAGAAQALDDMLALGVERVVVPVAGPDRFQSIAAISELADELNRSAELARERQLAIGYHNHFWEWAELPDGRLAYDVLAERLTPAVFFELDVYWAAVAGQDPADVIRRHQDRIRLLHMKDGPADDPAAPMTAAGEGVIDLAGAARAGDAVEWHIVELDRCATDMIDAVEKSHAWLVSRGISEGAGRVR